MGEADVLRKTLDCDTAVVGSTEQELPTRVSSVGLKWPGYIRPPGFVTRCRLSWEGCDLGEGDSSLQLNQVPRSQ